MIKIENLRVSVWNEQIRTYITEKEFKNVISFDIRNYKSKTTNLKSIEIITQSNEGLIDCYIIETIEFDIDIVEFSSSSDYLSINLTPRNHNETPKIRQY